MKIYVVWWQYSDRSGFGMVQAFRTRDAADNFMGIMIQHGDSSKGYGVYEVSMMRGEYPL